MSTPPGLKTDILFVRDPIFDSSGKVYGYEILYWDADDGALIDPALASRLITHALFGPGLKATTGGTRAFFDVNGSLLISGVLDVLNPEEVLLELTPKVEPTVAVTTECQRLAQQGFRLVLDDYRPNDPRADLMPWVSIIKINMGAHSSDVIRAFTQSIRDLDRPMVASGIADSEARDLAEDCGFDYFQGAFFEKAQPIHSQDLSVQQTHLLELLGKVHRVEVPTDELVEAVHHDPGLTYKILQMANTAVFGTRRIESVNHAINVMGRDALGRWLALLLAASQRNLTGSGREVFKATHVTARLCELLTEDSALDIPPATLFLAGLFGGIGRALGLSTEVILEKISLSVPLEDAILRGEGPYAPILDLVHSYNPENWASVEQHADNLGIPPYRVTERYLEAITWTQEREALLLDD